MKALLANPIYDSTFKFLMEDEFVAKTLLSALLKKDVVKVEMRCHEYTSMEHTKITLFRIDFSAVVRNTDGTEQLVLIEIQKTWLATETLRFRQYLGTQYLNKNNMVSSPEASESTKYGLPMVSIYLLGHKLGELKEPVIYVRRKYLDYDNNELSPSDRFIESLTHDSIIVQIPFLSGKVRNRLEQLLSFFDQRKQKASSSHFLEMEISESDMLHDRGLSAMVNRLVLAAAEPQIRKDMEIEDEILSEIEARDTTIMLRNKEIEKQTQEIEQKSQEIEQKSQEIEQKSHEIEQQQHLLKVAVQMLVQNGNDKFAISQMLSLSVKDIEELLG